jgi:signal transduction histidine kinase
VCNSGPDIPADRQQALFERFARAPAAARTPGVGLGLAFVHAVAARHEGSVRCTSAGGQTVFSVTLPMAREA